MSELAMDHTKIARFVDGQAPLSVEPGLTASEVTRWLKRNKYPLLACAERAPDWLVGDQTFARELAAERAWYETQRSEYLLVQQAWLAQGIECLMIKSAGNPPSFPHTSDNIDVAVHPEHGQAARDILRRLGYVEVRNVEEPSKFLFRKFRAGECVSAIHVHEQVIWFVGFMDEQALWSRMRPAADDPFVNVPSAEDAILINLAHACYENKTLRLNDVIRVRHALKSKHGDVDWSYMVRVAAVRGWLDGLAWMLLVFASVEEKLFGATLVPPGQQQSFERLIRGQASTVKRLHAIRAEQTGDLPLDLSYWLCKRLYYRKILADPTRTRALRWRDSLLTLLWGVKLKSGVRPQPGMVVSISGPDGAGKTAHAQSLTEAFRVCGIKTDCVWSRGGSTGVAGLVHRLRRLDTEGDRMCLPQDNLARRRRRLANPVVRFIWSWAIAADGVATYLLRAHLPAALGRVVVADRHVYDTAVEMDLSLPADARWSRRAIAAMLAMTPRPHLAYVLDVSNAAAKARKRDEAWHADFDGERRRYRALAERLNLRQVSNEGSFAEVNDALIRQTIMAYMTGYETWLNALFWANPSQKNRPDLAWASEGALL